MTRQFCFERKNGHSWGPLFGSHEAIQPTFSPILAM